MAPRYDDLIEVIEDTYSEGAQPVRRQYDLLEHSAPQLTSSVNTSHTEYSPQPTPIEQLEVLRLEEPDSIPMLEYDDSCPKTASYMPYRMAPDGTSLLQPIDTERPRRDSDSTLIPTMASYMPPRMAPDETPLLQPLERSRGDEACVVTVAVEGDNDRDQVDTVSESCELHKCRPDADETDDNSTMCGRVKNFFIQRRGLLYIPLVLVFGILLYLVDVGSDVMAAVDHFEEGHPVWGSLTITFIVLPALFWAAVSWTWWYYDPQERKDRYKTHRMKRMRRMRMLLAVLLLDPLTR